MGKLSREEREGGAFCISCIQRDKSIMNPVVTNKITKEENTDSLAITLAPLSLDEVLQQGR